jgi:predicted membrane-bound spermidine synthase
MTSQKEESKELRMACAYGALAGGALMVGELVFARMLASTHGNSIHVWGGIIAATLGASGLGALVADGPLKHVRPSVAAAAWTLGAAIGMAWAAFGGTHTPTLWPGDTTLSAALATALFLGPAAFCLGASFPTAVAWGIEATGDGPKAAAKASASSTLGSVAGTLAPPMLLLPLMPTDSLLVGTGLILATAGSWLLHRTKPQSFFRASKHVSTGICVCLALALIWSLSPQHEESTRAQIKGQYYTMEITDQIQSPYQNITILTSHDEETGQGLKMMMLNRQVAGFEGIKDYGEFWQNARPDKTQNGRYATAYYLGGGPMILPRLHRKSFPQDNITVFEIDPCVVTMAQKHFGKIEGAQIIVGDARLQLREMPDGAADAVFCDTYRDKSLPGHLTTTEFFSEVKTKLAKTGIVTINIIGHNDTKDPGPQVRSLLAALKENFAFQDAHMMPNPGAKPGAKGRANHLLRASDNALPAVKTGPEDFLPTHPEPSTPPLDRHNPVEWMKE